MSPDITMCHAETCPDELSNRCYRYTAKPDEYRQYYFSISPFLDGDCEYFWEVKEEEDD